MCDKSMGKAGAMDCCAQMSAMSAEKITNLLEAKKAELQLTSEQITQVADVVAASTAPKDGCCHRSEHSQQSASDH